jgi:integrase/recombinase XerD
MNELAEKGASVLQMQAWIGHLSLSEIELYTRKAQRRAAFSGMEQEQNSVKHDRQTRKK